MPLPVLTIELMYPIIFIIFLHFYFIFMLSPSVFNLIALFLITQTHRQETEFVYLLKTWKNSNINKTWLLLRTEIIT